MGWGKNGDADDIKKDLVGVPKYALENPDEVELGMWGITLRALWRAHESARAAAAAGAGLPMRQGLPIAEVPMPMVRKLWNQGLVEVHLEGEELSVTEYLAGDPLPDAVVLSPYGELAAEEEFDAWVEGRRTR